MFVYFLTDKKTEATKRLNDLPKVSRDYKQGFETEHSDIQAWILYLKIYKD